MKRDSRGSTGKSSLLTSNEILPVQRYQCVHCVLIFASKLELLEHLGKDHDLNVDKAIRNAGKSGHLTSNRILPVQRYQCVHCVRLFASKLQLLEHLGKEHGLDVEDAIRNVGKPGPPTSSQTPQARRFQCSHCVLIFESKLVLLEHLGKEHGLDVHKAIRNATSMGDAGPNKKPSNDIAIEKDAPASQPEENKLNATPDMLTKVKVKKPVANEKSNPLIAKPTSKKKHVSTLAGPVKGNQETSRKITQYFTATSGQKVKSSFNLVTSPDLVHANTACTAKKTSISQKSNPATNSSNGCASPFKSPGPPCEFDVPLITDPTKRVLEDPVHPPAKKPKHGLIKIRLPKSTPRKPHFQESSTVTLELSTGEEAHKSPQDGINSKQLNGNAVISPSKKMEDNPTPKSPPSKIVRADLKCDSCSFGHKSVVAMFVHYQGHHPEIVITLDQIRRRRSLVSDTKTLLPETVSEDVNMDAPSQEEKPTDPSEENPSSGSSEKTKVQSESIPEEIPSAVKPDPNPDPPSQGQHPFADAAGSPCSVRSVRTLTPTPNGQKTQRGASTSPPGAKPCSAAEGSEEEESPVITRPRISKKTLRGNLTPPEHEDPVQMEPCAGAEAPASPAVDLKGRGNGKAKKAGAPMIRGSRVKNLFFCPHCNYGNCVLRLVLVHFKNKHKGFQTTSQTISNYTASIHRKMKKSNSPNNEITVLSSGLPVPILQDEDFFFCPLCNYGNQLISRVMDHQNKSHPDVKRSKRQILEYTAEVYEQPREEQLKFEALSRLPDPPLGERKTVPFICHKCDYTAVNAYLLKRHLRRTHQINQSTEKILRTAFAKGRIEEGFHCQWCNFSDKKAERVFEHYKERHKSNVSSLKHIINHFHMAPKDAPSKKTTMRWDQGSGTNKAKTFSCKTCSFKGSSLKDLTKHNLTVHLRPVKGKASAFDDTSTADDQNSHALAADGQQEVLDYNPASQTLEHNLSSQSTPSSKSYMCRCCSLLFSTWQGLKIHYGMKHFEEWKSQPALFEEEEVVLEGDRTKGNVVYKCPWCVYAHTTRPGVTSHCFARHPTKKIRAEGFERHFAHVPHASKGGLSRSRVRVGGYMCQTCKEVCRSLKKFNMHNMKCHGDSVSCVLKPSAKYALTKQLLSKYQGSQGSMKKGFSKKNPPGLMKCPLCKHVGKSKEALAKHVDACSKSMRDVFKCTVCSYITLSNKYLRQHYRTRHGIHSKAPAMEYTAVSYNCKLCPYVSSKRRYLVCHYTKSHGMDPPREIEDNKSLECKKCSQKFKSPSGLGAHYTGVHLAHFQMDFKVLYRSAKRRAVAGYACHYCRLEVQTTRELGVHLDLHREQERRPTSRGALTTSGQCNGKEVSPKPQTSPDPAPEPASKKGPPGSEVHSCGLCGRWFPSLVGLRVHERRSHGDEAPGQRLDLGPAARSKDRFDQCTMFRPGSLKAFHCLICAYRTNLLCLLRSHFRKKHPDDLAERSAGLSESVEEEEEEEEGSPPAAGDPQAEGDPPAAPPDLHKEPSPAPQPAAKTSKHSVYSEPAEVQRQLSHYRSMAPANSAAPLAAEVAGGGLLLCEFCDFSSGHWSSVRRHYMNIHGKKVHRCRDCCFFTGLRRKLDLHKKTGHCGGPAEPPPQKSLRCPLCLYHTTSRDRLVDHVVLHRQERVVPIELRRPKLSRYLVGVVFRCQACTFTCGSAGALGTHALKHGPAGPYACRLCYFHCPRLSQLEAHLCDKHQVERNHELVGQVNLDHLGARAEGGEEEEEEEDGDEEDAGSSPREVKEKEKDEEVVTEGCDEVQRQEEQGEQEKQEEQDVTSGPLRTGAQEPLRSEEERQRSEEEEERQRSEEEEERRRSEEEEERRRSEEEEERRRRGDVRPTAAPTGSENECFGSDGLTSKRRAGGEVSEPGDGGAVGTPHDPGPPGGLGPEDGRTRRSSPDWEAQRSSSASELRLLGAAPFPDPPRPADPELSEEPFLSPEVPGDRRPGPGDELGSPEMPVLENVYLDHRLPGQGSLPRGEPGRQEAPGEAPSGGAVDQRPDRSEALGGSEEPETSPAKGASADHSAAAAAAATAPRPRSEDHGALSCTYCGRIFSCATELQGHVKRHRI